MLTCLPSPNRSSRQQRRLRHHRAQLIAKVNEFCVVIERMVVATRCSPPVNRRMNQSVVSPATAMNVDLITDPDS